jgi:hypothetical protein
MNIELIEKSIKELANESRETNNAFLGLQELVRSVSAKMYQFEVHLASTVSQQGIFEKTLLEMIKDWKKEREEFKQAFKEQQDKMMPMHLELLKELRQQQEEHKAGMVGQKEDFGKWLEGKQLIAPAVDMKPLAEKVANGISNMHGVVKDGVSGINQSVKVMVTEGVKQVSQLVEAQPKAVVRQWRFLFYPEDYKERNYKYLVRAIMLTSLGIVLAFFLYSIGTMALQEHSYTSSGNGTGEKKERMGYHEVVDSINSLKRQVYRLRK